MSIELIVVVAQGGIIGDQGKMPWGRIKTDLEHFRNITNGQIVVMGYKTLVSIGKELPGRRVLVLTHHPEKLVSFPWCEATTVDAVLEMAKTERIIIAGGENVYREFIPHATIAHITRIQAYFRGDTYFPKLSSPEWYLESYRFWNKGDNNPYPLRFEIWYKRGKALPSKGGKK